MGEIAKYIIGQRHLTGERVYPTGEWVHSIAKYGGTAQITGEDMRRRNGDNAKVRAACADQAEEWAVRGDYAYVPTYWRIDGERNPDPRSQAILRHDTTCTSCGQRIKAGDEIVITFAKAPAEGTFRHADCEPTNG